MINNFYKCIKETNGIKVGDEGWFLGELPLNPEGVVQPVVSFRRKDNEDLIDVSNIMGEWEQYFETVPTE